MAPTTRLTDPDRTAATAPATPRRRPRRRARSLFGSTRQLPSGRWQARYRAPDGTRHTAPRTFDTRREAENWLATSRADMVRGDYHSPTTGTVTLAEYSAEFLAARVDLSPSTAHSYAALRRLWLAADLAHPGSGRTVNIGGLQLRQITPATVAEWHAAALSTAQRRARERAAARDRRRRERAVHAARAWALENGHPVKATGRLPAAVLAAWRASGAPSAATYDLPPTEPDRNAGRVQVAQAYRLLRTILNAALRDGLIRANPCTIKGAGTTRTRDRVPATVADLKTIAAHMPPRYAAAVHVAAFSGLRAGELFALTRSAVDLTRGTLRVERALIKIPGEPLRFGPPKTTSSVRTVTLPGPIVELLAAHMATYTRPGPDALIFATDDGRPLDPDRRTTLFRAACAHAGRHDLRWHDLRHTGATMFARAGGTIRELQARLGHSTIAAAMIYQHASEERDREVAERMSALITPGPRPGGPALRVVSS